MAPRVTLEHIESCIVGELFLNAGECSPLVAHGEPPGPLSLLTVCVLTLRNGFTVVGTSACASPENYNRVLGCQIARRNAVEEVWKLEGYALRERLHAAT